METPDIPLANVIASDALVVILVELELLERREDLVPSAPGVPSEWQSFKMGRISELIHAAEEALENLIIECYVLGVPGIGMPVFDRKRSVLRDRNESNRGNR